VWPEVEAKVLTMLPAGLEQGETSTRCDICAVETTATLETHLLWIADANPPTPHFNHSHAGLENVTQFGVAPPGTLILKRNPPRGLSLVSFFVCLFEGLQVTFTHLLSYLTPAYTAGVPTRVHYKFSEDDPMHTNQQV
jgi:hypothetical protein